MPHFTNYLNLSDELKQAPISDLIENAKSLVKERRYSQSTIWHYNERFNDLKKSALLFSTERLSEEFITQFIEEGCERNPRLTNSSVRRKALLNLIATSINNPSIFTYKKIADNIHDKSLQENLIIYEQHLKKQGKRDMTRKSYLQVATNFLIYLDNVNKIDLSKVTAIDIREFIIEFSARWSSRSMWIVPSLLKTYLKFAGVQAEAIRFSSFRPPHKSKPVFAMSNENTEALWTYVEGSDGDLRSKAIVTILLTTGMRSVDITNLELDNINWNSDTLGFTQSKTGEFMNVKLFPVMGSAIVRYIFEQRPKGTGEKFIFLSKVAPYRKLTSSICNRILIDALEKIGIPFVPDGLHCPRAVRRSLVSRMISKGVPVQKAAASIGHVDEKSVDLYTELDVEKMRSICLPIPNSMKGWWLVQ